MIYCALYLLLHTLVSRLPLEYLILILTLVAPETVISTRLNWFNVSLDSNFNIYLAMLQKDRLCLLFIGSDVNPLRNVQHLRNSMAPVIIGVSDGHFCNANICLQIYRYVRMTPFLVISGRS